jgi:AraC family transcriptional regulator
MSHYHFMRVFKESVGMPASRFHTMQRIEKAKELLLKDERIVDVAHALGFSSQAHFGNVFARTVGVTPRKFRLQRQVQA